VLVLDADGRIVRFNKFAEELTGYTQEEALGRDWFTTFLPGRDHSSVRGIFRRILAGRTERGHENPVVAKDGREILIRWYNSLLRDADGNPVGVLALGHDITEIRRTQEQLHQAAKMEAIGRLAGGIAHDFNNMLAIIQGYADMLAGSLAADQRAEDVQAILAAARRAAGLTRRLLAFGRKQVTRPQVLRVDRIVSSMESMLQRTLGDDVQLAIRPGRELWHVKADPGQIEELILNLAVNARDAMPGGGKLTIRAANAAVSRAYAERHRGLEPGQYVALTVRDTGLGMDEALKSHIFEPFFTTKSAGEGTGLGLATCYGIVQQSRPKMKVLYVSGYAQAPPEAPGRRAEVLAKPFTPGELATAVRRTLDRRPPRHRAGPRRKA